MSAVRLEPDQAKVGIFAAVSRSRMRAKPSSSVATSWPAFATRMCTGATMDAPRPPHAARHHRPRLRHQHFRQSNRRLRILMRTAVA